MIKDPWAINSAGEYYPHTVGVTGSNPVSPTTEDTLGPCESGALWPTAGPLGFVDPRPRGLSVMLSPPSRAICPNAALDLLGTCRDFPL